MKINSTGLEVMKLLPPDDAKDVLQRMQEIEALRHAMGAVENEEKLSAIYAAQSRLIRLFYDKLWGLIGS